MMLWALFRAWVGKSLPWIWIIILLFVGLILLLYGIILEHDSRLKQLAMSLGSAVTSGGIAALVLKLLAIEGYFLQAVAQYSVSPGNLSRLNDLEKQKFLDAIADEDAFSKLDLSKIQHKVIEFIYLPHFNLFRNKDTEEIRNKLRDAIRNKFSYDVEFYINELNRTLRFSWENKNKKSILLTESSRLHIVPFDKGKIIKFSHVTRPDSGIDIDHRSSITKCIFANGEKIETSVIRDSITGAITTTYNLPVRDSYEIIRDRTLAWSLKSEPYYSFLSPYVMNIANITVENLTQDQNIAIWDVGGMDLFAAVVGNMGLIRPGESASLRSTRIILPKEGLTAIFSQS